MTGRPDGAVLRSVVVLAGLVVAGFVAIGLAWRGLAAEASVARQLPFLVSGGVGGLALVATGTTLLAVQRRRIAEARRRAILEELLDATMAQLDGAFADREAAS